MPLLKPTFIVPGSVPFISGQWGPFVNTTLSFEQKKGLFLLFFVSICLILIFAIVSYIYNRDYAVPCKEVSNSDDSFDYFINSKIDIGGFLLGMMGGVIFGFIDNAGLWYGMDSLDPVFEPSQVPWVYGNGGRRYYTGLDSHGNSVYKDVKFADGKLNSDQLKKLEKTSQHIKEYYQNKLKLKKASRAYIDVNEACYANPNSDMFLGHSMNKSEFIKAFTNKELGQKLYNKKIEYYSDYLNQRKNKHKKHKNDFTKTSSRHLNPWPGSSKSLADASVQGWSPGKLTQAGIGNTFSDALGGFLSTFIAVMIIGATGQCTISLISEVIGLIFGCILGIMFARLTPFSNKT